MKSSLLTIIFSTCAVFAVAQETPLQQTPPPAQQTPPTPPGQTPPPTVPATPAATKPSVDITPTKPPPPKTVDRDTGGDVFSIEPIYWLVSSSPRLRTGANYLSTYVGNLNLTGDRKYADGGMITIPTTHEDSVQISYLRNQGQSNVVLGNYYTFFGNDFTTGDTVATHYTTQIVKASWNYLTYPYPSAGAKWRLKTLWEVQWVTVGAGFDAPADVNATTTLSSRNVVLPTLGLGGEYHPARNIRFELKASGFGIPHHADIYDVEASLVARVSKLEISVGGKAYHYKTSPKQDQFFDQTLLGPYVAIRWMFR